MGQIARVGKIEEWTKRLARFEVAGETVARFCRGEGVSESTFYAWKQRLRAAATPAGAARSAGTIRSDSATLPTGASPPFLPVEIAPAQPASAQRATVVRLAGDIQIEFGGDLPVVATVVEQLLRATGAARPTEDRAC
jgi:transposase-like protein